MADGDATPMSADGGELRKQLEAAEATAHIGSWEWTVATGAVTWSDELYRIYGLEPDSVAISLEFFLSRTHPGERDPIEREIQAALQHPGPFAAIEWQAEEFERRGGTPCTVRSNLSDLQLDRDLATNLFRIFQESLTNVARHANAEHVDVAIRLDHGRLHLEIADDGVGVPEIGPRGATLGLLGMRERAWRLGGDCTIKRRTPRGTIVSVIVPLKFPAERLGGVGS
jgi:PAS domain-containing protein